MRDCKSKNLTPGIDLGVLSHNDEPAKEITGITTFSSDFSNMGRMAGRAILNKERIQLTVPMILYERHSL
jgi:DNA-binding LacI/PurR family transcriptional regulator